MITLSGHLIFRFLGEGNQSLIKVNAEEFELENTWTDEDRGMGSEIGYESVVEINHPSNDKKYQIRFECSEYPVGAPNYEDLSIIDENGDSANVEIIENTLTIFN